MEDTEQQYPDEPSFSFDDFKEWMGQQQDKPIPKRNKQYIGQIVESKLSLKRLVKRMEVEEGDLEEMAKEFRRHGGTILDIDDNLNLLVEVDSGTFRIPKFFVKKQFKDNS